MGPAPLGIKQANNFTESFMGVLVSQSGVCNVPVGSR